MVVNSAPIWVTPPNSSVEVAATQSILLNFTVRARPAATFEFSFQNTEGKVVKIDSSGSHYSILFFILIFIVYAIIFKRIMVRFTI